VQAVPFLCRYNLHAATFIEASLFSVMLSVRKRAKYLNHQSFRAGQADIQYAQHFVLQWSLGIVMIKLSLRDMSF